MDGRCRLCHKELKPLFKVPEAVTYCNECIMSSGWVKDSSQGQAKPCMIDCSTLTLSPEYHSHTHYTASGVDLVLRNTRQKYYCLQQTPRPGWITPGCIPERFAAPRPTSPLDLRSILLANLFTRQISLLRAEGEELGCYMVPYCRRQKGSSRCQA